MNYISLTISNDELTELLKKYKFTDLSNENKNIKYQLKIDNNVITIYNTNVLLIQGKNSELTYKKIFKRDYIDIDPIKNTFITDDSYLNQNKELEQYYTNSIGSDEVGNGDFYLGICVCACYVRKDQIEWLKSLGVKDSKKIDDAKIISIAKELINNISYASINLDAIEYNKLYKKINNLNAIKAYLHNKCFYTLISKVKKPYFIVIDQFVNQSKYYEYLINLKAKIVNVDCFSTKAEDKYYAVACGAILARYFHLELKKQYEEKYNVKIPLGSSNTNIKDFSKEFIDKFGLKEFSNLVKHNFKTYDEILELFKKENK